MSPPPLQASANVPPERRRRRILVRRALGFVGVALIGAAVAVAAGQLDIDRIAAAPPVYLLALAAAVAGNLVVTGLLFWAVTRPFDLARPVGPTTMIGLIAASALLNYLPLRPGLLGRAAWLKQRHGLPLRQSGLILLIVLGMGVWVLCGVALVMIVTAPHEPRLVLALACGAALLLAPLVGPVTARILRRPMPGAVWWTVWRLMDLLLGGARVWLSFAIVGLPVTFPQAVVLSAAGMLVSLTGVTPNGLGLREWVMAGLASLVAPDASAIALAAAVFERAIEALVVITMGGASLAWLARSAGRHPDDGPAPPAGDGPPPRP